jgi:hypothetical protein
VAPGLTEGMVFDQSQTVSKESKTVVPEQPKVMTLADIMTLGDDLDDLDLGGEEENEENFEIKVSNFID